MDNDQREADEWLGYKTVTLEMEKLFSRHEISPVVMRNAKVDVFRDAARNVVLQFSTYLAAKSHEERFDEDWEGSVAPGLWNNLKQWLNSQWPFSRYFFLHVKEIRFAHTIIHKHVRICPHIDLPDLKGPDLKIHIAYLEDVQHLGDVR